MNRAYLWLSEDQKRSSVRENERFRPANARLSEARLKSHGSVKNKPEQNKQETDESDAYLKSISPQWQRDSKHYQH